jgi:pimeloyl-ACP methyl ester carboxylesterase
VIRRSLIVYTPAHDWGGVIAWAFAMHHPQYLSRLVILNAPHPTIFARELMHNPAQQAASQYMLLLKSPEAESKLSANDFAWLREITLSRGLRDGLLTNDDTEAYLSAWRQPGALTAMLNYYRASGFEPGKAPAPKDTPKIEVPTLVLWGEDDRALTMGNLLGLEAYVTNLKVKTLPKTSHWIVQEQSEVVCQEIRIFL